MIVGVVRLWGIEVRACSWSCRGEGRESWGGGIELMLRGVVMDDSLSDER